MSASGVLDMIYEGVELYNVQALIPCPDSNEYRMSRIPEALRTQLNPGAQNTAFNGSGVEIRFNLVGDSATITLRRAPDEGIPGVGIGEVWYGNFPAAYGVTPILIRSEPTTITIRRPENIERLVCIAKENHLPFDPSLIRVRLPYDYQNRFIGVEGDVTPPLPTQAPGRKFIAYGSSITHGGDAVRPSGSYIMRTAERLGCDVINLGFAGSAHLEPVMADYIADRDDWDFATLELGINVVGQWTVEQFAERVQYFITRIATQHVDKWVFCTDIFTCSLDINQDPKVEAYREVVRTQVERLNLPRLCYVSGRQLLSSVHGLTADLVHPAASGIEEMAANLSQFIRDRIGLSY